MATDSCVLEYWPEVDKNLFESKRLTTTTVLALPLQPLWRCVVVLHTDNKLTEDDYVPYGELQPLVIYTFLYLA